MKTNAAVPYGPMVVVVFVGWAILTVSGAQLSGLKEEDLAQLATQPRLRGSGKLTLPISNYLQERAAARAWKHKTIEKGGSGGQSKTWQAKKGKNTIVRIESKDSRSSHNVYWEWRNKNSGKAWEMGCPGEDELSFQYGKKGSFNKGITAIAMTKDGKVTFHKRVIAEKDVKGMKVEDKSDDDMLLQEDESGETIFGRWEKADDLADAQSENRKSHALALLEERESVRSRGTGRRSRGSVEFYSAKGDAAFRVESRDSGHNHNVYVEFRALHKTKTWIIGMKNNQELVIAYGAKGSLTKHVEFMSMETDGKVTIHKNMEVAKKSMLLAFLQERAQGRARARAWTRSKGRKYRDSRVKGSRRLSSTNADTEVRDLSHEARSPDYIKGSKGSAEPVEVLYSKDDDAAIIISSKGGGSWIEFRNKKSSKAWGIGVDTSNDLRISYGEAGVYKKSKTLILFDHGGNVKFYGKPTFKGGIEKSKRSTSSATRRQKKKGDKDKEDKEERSRDAQEKAKILAAIKECEGNPLVKSTPEPMEGSTTLKPNFQKNNFCLDTAKGTRKRSGANVMVWECMTKKAGQGQSWKIDEKTKQIVSASTGNCLSTVDSDTPGKSGLNVITVKCKEPKEPEAKQGGADKDDAKGSATETVGGVEEKEEKCKSCEEEEVEANNQQWEFQGNNKFIKHVATGKCLNVAESALRNGANVLLWDCENTKAGEQWACGHQCHHGGTQNPSDCQCECQRPWEGFSCNECSAKCLNGGTLVEPCCMCKCPELWGGKACEKCLRKCYNEGSLDAGRCQCQCKGYWTGPECTQCEIPCQNGGVPDPDTCTCNCEPAKYWTGEFCHEKLFIDEELDGQNNEQTIANLIHEMSDERKKCKPEPLFEEPVYSKLDVKIHRNKGKSENEFKIELQFELSIIEAHILQHPNGTLQITELIPPICDIAMVSGAFIEMLDHFDKSAEVKHAFGVGMMAINQERSGKCGKSAFDKPKLLSVESKSIEGVIYKMGVNVGRKVEAVIWVWESPSRGKYEFIGSTPPPCHIGEILETTYSAPKDEDAGGEVDGEEGESKIEGNSEGDQAMLAAIQLRTTLSQDEPSDAGREGDDETREEGGEDGEYMPEVDEDVVEVPPAFDARLKWPECFNQSLYWSIQDESLCGASWAIASTAVFSHRLCVLSNQKVQKSFSPWEQVLCNDKYPVGGTVMEMGCEGGLPVFSWRYMAEEGMVEEDCLPYPDHDTHLTQVVKEVSRGCKEKVKCPKDKIGKCTKMKVDPETIMRPRHDEIEVMQRQILKAGAIQAEMVAHQDFAHYGTGVYSRIDNKDNFPVGARSVALVGWGTDEDTGEPYWIAENSFGGDWGEAGHFRIKRGANEVGIESSVTWGDPSKANCKHYKGEGESSCLHDGRLEPYSCTCECQGGWSGDLCETCALDCQNGGELDKSTCTCMCKGSWHGKECEQGADMCACSMCGPQYHCGGEDACPKMYNWCKIHPKHMNLAFDGRRGKDREEKSKDMELIDLEQAAWSRTSSCPDMYEKCEP